MSKNQSNDETSILTLAKKRVFENGDMPPFSKLKKITNQELLKMVILSENQEQTLYDLEELSKRLDDFVNNFKLLKMPVRIKYILKQFQRPECQTVIMDILGITSTGAFQPLIEKLINQGRIRKIGLDDIKAQQVAEVYGLTKSRVRTSAYYINVPENDFKESDYFWVDKELEARVREKIESFNFLKSKAKEIRLQPRTKLGKCIVALREWHLQKVTIIQMMEYLSLELEIAPKSEKLFLRYVKLFEKNGAIKEEIDQFGNKIFEIKK